MLCLTIGIVSEKFLLCSCVYIIEWTCTILECIAYYTPRLYHILLSYMWFVVDQNIVMWHMILYCFGVFSKFFKPHDILAESLVFLPQSCFV